MGAHHVLYAVVDSDLFAAVSSSAAGVCALVSAFLYIVYASMCVLRRDFARTRAELLLLYDAVRTGIAECAGVLDSYAHRFWAIALRWLASVAGIQRRASCDRATRWMLVVLCHAELDTLFYAAGPAPLL